MKAVAYFVALHGRPRLEHFLFNSLSLHLGSLVPLVSIRGLTFFISAAMIWSVMATSASASRRA
jgi:hypothetical protein